MCVCVSTFTFYLLVDFFRREQSERLQAEKDARSSALNDQECASLIEVNAGLRETLLKSLAENEGESASCSNSHRKIQSALYFVSALV